MHEMKVRKGVLVATAALVAAFSLPPMAGAAQGKIVCWKDATGKVIGCGDKVPPEYQGAATKEMDSHGVTRKQTESVEEAARRRAKEQEAARAKAEQERVDVNQQRLDNALLATYANEQEIDLKRDRDLQVVDLQIEQLEGALKNATRRYNDVKARVDAIQKNKKPVGAGLKDDLERVAQEKQRYEQTIAARKKEKEELKLKYAEYRKRYSELRARQATAARK